MRKKILAVTIFILSILVAADAFAEQKESVMQRLRKRFTKPKTVQSAAATAKAQEPVVKEKKKSQDEMSQSELASVIKEELLAEPEIIDFLPNMKKQVKGDGTVFFTYRVENVDTPIEEIDKERLNDLLSSVYTHAALIRTKRIQEQLEAVSRIPRAPPAPPRVPTVPQIPSVSSAGRATTALPEVPKAPKAPPGPPRRP